MARKVQGDFLENKRCPETEQDPTHHHIGQTYFEVLANKQFPEPLKYGYN